MFGRFLRGAGKQAAGRVIDLVSHPQARFERFGHATAPGGVMAARDYIARLMGLAAAGGAAGGGVAAGQYIYDRSTRRRARRGDNTELMRKALEAEMRAKVARARYIAFLNAMRDQISTNNNDEPEGMR